MDGDLQRTVGRNLRAYRDARGLTQRCPAQLLGYSRSYVSRLERGQPDLSLRSVERLADRLAMEPLELLRRRGGP
jgi:transcriptional regulator with XRE-family HTH domain